MKIHRQFLQLGSTNVLLAVMIVFAFYYHNFGMGVAGALMLVVSFLPFYLKAAHDIFIPAIFIYVTIAFIFISVFFGQFNGMYDRWHWSDSVLHFISALAFGFGGFLLLYVYYVHNKLKLPKGLIILFTFFFCLGIGGLWEIIEYILDHTIGTNMQVNSLDDTMTDLMLDGLGGFVSTIFCSLFLSKKSVPIIDKAVHALSDEIITENKEVVKTTTNDDRVAEIVSSQKAETDYEKAIPDQRGRSHKTDTH